jgi:thioredoxin 1
LTGRRAAPGGETAAMANLQRVKDDTFETEVLKANIPVLVDFSAEWCGPCKALAPTLEALAAEFQGKVKFVTVDIDDSQRSADRFKISSVPTLMVFKSGEVLSQAMGNRPRNQIVDMLNKALGV